MTPITKIDDSLIGRRAACEWGIIPFKGIIQREDSNYDRYIIKEEDGAALIIADKGGNVYKGGITNLRLTDEEQPEIRLKDYEAYCYELLEALNSLLNTDEKVRERYSHSTGCPMCDNGVLRNPDKEHWDNCNWNNARIVYEKAKAFTNQ